MSEEDYIEYFLNSGSAIVELDCLEISHTAFSETHYIVRNALHGVTVTHEDESSHFYKYCPMKLSVPGPQETLDYNLGIQLGDVGEILHEEIQRILASGMMGEMPRVVYRTYRSDVLTTPLHGPMLLEVKQLAQTTEGSNFDAKAPGLNVNKTGEIYSLARFPMLRGLL